MPKGSRSGKPVEVPVAGTHQDDGPNVPADLTNLDLDQLMGIDITGDAPLPRPNTNTFNPQPGTPDANSQPGGQHQPVDLTLFGLDQLMGIDISSDAPLPPPTPSPASTSTSGVPDEGAVVEDVLADALGDGDDALPTEDDLVANGKGAGSQGDTAIFRPLGANLNDLGFGIQLALAGFAVYGSGPESLPPAEDLELFTDTGGATTGDPATTTIAGAASPVNNVPVATDDFAATGLDTPATISVLANDTDLDGDGLSVSAATQGANGTVTVNPDGTVTYTPNTGFSGSDSFTYTVDDGNGGTDTASVTATVGNLIEGGAGDDTLNGTAGVDVIFGYGGDDTLSGKKGNDSLHGGAGNDILKGQAGDDTLFGEDGDDDIRGGDGNDTLDGGAGNDFLRGGNGVDDLTGGDGNDTVDGGAGSDIARGGLGDDILVWDAFDPTIDGGGGSDTLRVDSGDADLSAFTGTISGIEVIDLATDAGANTVTLDAQDVLDMSDTDTVTITGDSTDSIDAGTGWTDGGISGGFHTYTQGLATLLVDTDVTVNADIIA